MPKLKRQADEVLKVFHQLNARPGDCVHFVTLVRNGVDEADVEPGVAECVRLGQLLAHEDCAELTEVGWKAISWDRPKAKRAPAAP